MTATSTYLIALGSNRPLSARLTPHRIVETAISVLDTPPCRLVRASSVIETAPLGPARRRFANAAAMIETHLPPPALLRHLEVLEARFGRRRHRRWGDRTLDLDIIAWSGGRWHSPSLVIPHRESTRRVFVLHPAAQIAPRWPLGKNGESISQSLTRMKRRKPVDPAVCAD